MIFALHALAVTPKQAQGRALYPISRLSLKFGLMNLGRFDASTGNPTIAHKQAIEQGDDEQG
jgi:hypothetical protein